MTRLLLAFNVALLVSMPNPGLGAERSVEHGLLFEVDGVRVLRVGGTPRERGQAHGELLGREIMEFLNGFLVGKRAKLFEKKVLPMIPLMFRWPAHIREELEGMIEGVEKTLTEEERTVASLGRTLKIDDLKAFNTLGDWISLSCSTLSAWGASTVGGRTLVGRNFDFVLPEQALKAQLVIAHEPGPGRKAFHTVSFPGNLGAITALNEDGVFVSVHDVHVLPKKPGLGYTPRLVTLRLIAERASRNDAVKTALDICRKHRSIYGNNFHGASPASKGDNPFGAVIEYDSDFQVDRGATLRTVKRPGPSGIWNTNHYRSRAPPGGCPRYARLTEGFETLAGEGRRLDVEAMKNLIRRASVRITMHVAVADLESRTLHLALQRRLFLSAGKEPFHTLKWNDVFGAPETAEDDSEF